MGDRERDILRLVTLSSVRNGREIRRIRLGEESIIGDKSYEGVVGPLPKRHDAAEGDVPASGQCLFGEAVRAGVTVEHSAHTGRGRISDRGARIVLGESCMNDDRPSQLGRELELRRECAQLIVARRMIVVVVETTFANGDSTIGDRSTDRGEIVLTVEVGRVVRVDPGREVDEARMSAGQFLGARRRGE